MNILKKGHGPAFLMNLMYLSLKPFKLYHPKLHSTNHFDTPWANVIIGDIGRYSQYHSFVKNFYKSDKLITKCIRHIKFYFQDARKGLYRSRCQNWSMISEIRYLRTHSINFNPICYLLFLYSHVTVKKSEHIHAYLPNTTLNSI